MSEQDELIQNLIASNAYLTDIAETDSLNDKSKINLLCKNLNITNHLLSTVYNFNEMEFNSEILRRIKECTYNEQE